MRVTNIAPGPRGIHTLAGTVYLQPGETGEYEVSEAEAGGILASPYFTVDVVDAEPIPAKRGRPRKNAL